MNEIYFLLSKLFWWFANPASLLLLLTATGVYGLWRGRLTAARWLLSIALGVMVALTVLPLRQWVVGPLESRFAAPTLPQSVTGIIILGGAIDPTLSRLRKQPVVNDAAERLVAGARLARLYPNARLVYSGGSAAVMGGGQDREADYAATLLSDLGVASGRSVFERDSRNTLENAIYTKRIIQPQPNETWLLVTSAMHMPRAVGLFRGQGWSVIPYPVDYTTSPWTGGRKDLLASGSMLDGLSALNWGSKEWIGLLAARLLGKTANLLPAP